jgi:hypothetical protein
MADKSADYAGEADPFANFRMFGDNAALLGICFRLGDKIRRLHKAAGGEKFAVDETLRDTTLDIINYAVLFLALSQELSSKP